MYDPIYHLVDIQALQQTTIENGDRVLDTDQLIRLGQQQTAWLVGLTTLETGHLQKIPQSEFGWTYPDDRVIQTGDDLMVRLSRASLGIQNSTGVGLTCTLNANAKFDLQMHPHTKFPGFYKITILDDRFHIWDPTDQGSRYPHFAPIFVFLPRSRTSTWPHDDHTVLQINPGFWNHKIDGPKAFDGYIQCRKMPHGNYIQHFCQKI